MPNYVTNVITCDKDIAEVIEFMKSEEVDDDNFDDDRGFDFNRLIPMPEELMVTSGTIGEAGRDYLKGDKKALDRFTDEKDKEEAIALGKQYIENKEKYGHETWYDWCYANWGTKWNACDVYVEECAIRFSTAWAHPYPIINALTKKFPDITFEMKYADEDTSNNIGHYTAKNGEVIDNFSPEEGSKEAYELAFELNGGEDYYKLVDGNYEYDEEAWG